MKEIEHVNSYKAAEIKLTYLTKQKPSDRFKIKDSNDAAELFFEIWNMETIEFIEEVKMAEPHAADTDDAIGKLITGSNVTNATENMPRYNGEGCTGNRPSAENVPSIYRFSDNSSEVSFVRIFFIIKSFYV